MKIEDMTNYDWAYHKLLITSYYQDNCCDLTLSETRAIIDKIRTLEYEKREVEEWLENYLLKSRTPEKRRE